MKLMELGAAAVGRRDELAVRAPAEASHGVSLERDRALWFPSGGRQRPRLVRAWALIGNHRERLGVRRNSKRGATGEPTGRVGNACQALARMEVR